MGDAPRRVSPWWGLYGLFILFALFAPIVFAIIDVLRGREGCI